MIPPGHKTLWYICDMHKGNNTNNRPTRPDNLYNRKELKLSLNIPNHNKNEYNRPTLTTGINLSKMDT